MHRSRSEVGSFARDDVVGVVKTFADEPFHVATSQGVGRGAAFARDVDHPGVPELGKVLTHGRSGGAD